MVSIGARRSKPNSVQVFAVEKKALAAGGWFCFIISMMTDLSTLLAQGKGRDTTFHEALAIVLKQFDSETGTIHVLDAVKQELHLAAQIGLPPAMLGIVQLIPVGKGIAGQTVAQGKPVSICNIQTARSGVAQPGAKQTGVGGALSVPMRADGKIVGTLGVGTARQHEYTAEETKALEAVGAMLGKWLATKPSQL